MKLRRLPAPALAAMTAAGLVALGVLLATISYRFSPLVALALPAALALVAVVVRWPQVGICAALAAVPLDSFHASSGSSQVTALKLLVLLSAGSIALRMLSGSDRLRGDPVLVAYTAGLLWIGTGFAVAIDTAVIVRTLVLWTALGVVALFIANSSPRQVRQVLWAITVSAAGTALIAIASGSTQQAVASGAAVTGRAVGSFTQPNQLAFFLVLSLPVGLVLAVLERRPLLRAIASGSVVAMFVALLLTLSRGAMIGAAAELLIMLMWASFRRVAASALLILALVVGFNFNAISHSKEISLVGQRIGTIFNAQQANVHNERLRIWKTVPRIVSDHPVFGLGLGNFPDYSLQYGLVEEGLPFDHAHDITLTVIAEQGIPGVLLFLVTCFLVLRKALFALGRRSSPLFPYAMAANAGLGGIFVDGIFDYPPGAIPNMTVIVVEIALLVGVTRLIAAEPSGLPR